ncbi:MAG: TIR domain-containing protein [Vicinamibacterales bacterium]
MSRRPKVFIGSSTEARQREIVPALVRHLADRFVVVPWYSHAIQASHYTLDALLEVARDVDLALFVFSADDTRTQRGTVGVATRDNVILEYGLFTAALGRERVAIFREEGVALPVDVQGLTVLPFAPAGEEQAADLELNARELGTLWQRPLPPPPNRIADANLGFEKALQDADRWLSTASGSLWAFSHHRVDTPAPLEFDSRRSCVTTYTEALDRVTRRFWTTSFLSSGFWGGNNGSVIRANTRMLERLAEGGDARRVFLINQPIDGEADAHKEQLVLERKYGLRRASEDRRRQFETFARSVQQLQAAGCKVRVAHVASVADQLPEEMKFDPTDSELALYDDWRVDVFSGGATGRISGVVCYTPATANFSSYLTESEHYFEHLWSASQSVDDLIAKVGRAHADAEARIDYESQWLAFYEFALPKEDADLKTVEIARVGEILRARGKWGALRRCLDVGTCTGRYPIFLCGGLGADGSVVGIDEDVDCVRFASANVRQRCEGDPRVHIQKADVTASTFDQPGPFDLVTCMLGTPSHFGRGRDRSGAADPADLLQQTIHRMAGLLAEDGLLILSTWSAHACDLRNMLSIYRDGDRARLAEWTPPIAELRARLRRANLEIVETAQPDPRLDLTVCRPAARRAAA